MSRKNRLPLTIESPYSDLSLESAYQKASSITPSFPNWERSFVSGHQSPLYKVTHHEWLDHPGFMISKVEFLPVCEGPPGHVHGGASAGLMDEVLGVCVWHQKHPCVTQSLTLHYGRTLPLEGRYYIVSKVLKVEGSLVEVAGTIFDQEKTPYVSAQGVFHRLTLDQLETFNKLKNKA